jgi:hypothetical protein
LGSKCEVQITAPSGDFFAIVFREADPPLANTNVERVVLNKLPAFCTKLGVAFVKRVNCMNRVELHVEITLSAHSRIYAQQYVNQFENRKKRYVMAALV